MIRRKGPQNEKYVRMGSGARDSKSDSKKKTSQGTPEKGGELTFRKKVGVLKRELAKSLKGILLIAEKEGKKKNSIPP